MNMQNFQTMRPAKPAQNGSQKIKLVSLIAAGLALLLTIAWFLPIISYSGHSFSFLDIFSTGRLFRVKDLQREMTSFWICVICSVLAIIWSALPKKWAAVTGVVFSSILAIECIDVANDFTVQGLDPAIGLIFLVLFSLALLAMSIVKLVLIQKERKNYRTMHAGQPRTAYGSAGYEYASRPQTSATQSGYFFCPNCGTKLTQETKFCVNCGQNVSDKNQPAQPSNQKEYSFYL